MVYNNQLTKSVMNQVNEESSNTNVKRVVVIPDIALSSLAKDLITRQCIININMILINLDNTLKEL